MSPDAGDVLRTEVVPRLRASIPFAVNFIGCEDAEEIIADATAFAAKMIHNSEKAGKRVTRAATGRRNQISAGNIAYFTIQHLKSGRRSTGSSKADVYGSWTQLAGRTRLHSLEEVVAEDQENGGEIFLLHDVLSDDREDPSTKATRKMDWEQFIDALPERERLAIEFMLEGKSLRDAAHVLRVSDSSMQSSKRSLRVKILEFMGAEILVEIQRRPRWKEHINAARERMACRYDRCH
jgi:hypothetical protein